AVAVGQVTGLPGLIPVGDEIIIDVVRLHAVWVLHPLRKRVLGVRVGERVELGGRVARSVVTARLRRLVGFARVICAGGYASGPGSSVCAAIGAARVSSGSCRSASAPADTIAAGRAETASAGRR